MKKKSNTGRKKRVTPASGSVYKRGSGINSSGPVGQKDGYTKRKKQRTQSSNQGMQMDTQQSNQGTPSIFNSASSTGNRESGSKWSLKKILIIAAVLIVGYFLLRNFLGSGSNVNLAPNTNNNNSNQIVNNDTNALQLNTTVSDDARDKRTVIQGNGKDVYTIMIYMCASDLESKSGMATADLQEILNADISDKVNIIVETGGAKTWKNNIVSNKTNERYQLTEEGMIRLEDNLGRKIMTDPDTLSDFIKYTKKNYPADRYALIMWDHGVGSVKGFGYDEFALNQTMTLDEINTALDDANCIFDFIGFDACLMATYETALMLDQYADYLIASEETEPGIGWYYTDWISELSKNTSMSTLEIGKNIIDDFIAACYQNSLRDKTTLSIVDLAELSSITPEPFKAFAMSTGALIESEEYKMVSDARSGTREFGQTNRLDQIDLIHLAQNIGTDEADDLIDDLQQCIKYNRTSNTISNANGLSIYFPYGKLSAVGSMLNTYEEIGMDEEYSDCIKSFANLEVGGQAVSSGSGNPLGSLLGSLTGSSGGTNLIGGLLSSFLQGGNFGDILGGAPEDSNTDWVDPNQIAASQDYYENNYFDNADLALTEKDGGYVLSMTDKQWDMIQNVNLNVFFDDGEGYIDLGLDNVYEFDEDDDLVIGFDGTWIAINGQVVSYYFISEEISGNDYTITGRVPAMLNDELVDLILVFDNDNPYGSVIGARTIYQEDPSIVAKGLIKIQNGDVIDFVCDYYTYDEEYDDSYLLGDQLVVTGSLKISNVELDEAEWMVCYKLIDIYNNSYWTPAVMYQ
ncbi:MAG: peptidase C11 [Clostridiales bacterium]|nr:peptidase C11 [Clostridiales bacterium]